MSNPINYQQQTIPGYSGITINITNPTMHAGGANNCKTCDSLPAGAVVSTVDTPVKEIADNKNYVSNGMMTPINPATVPAKIEPIQNKNVEQVLENLPTQNQDTLKEGIPQAYPPQYYLNNYNYVQGGEKGNVQKDGVNYHVISSADSQKDSNNDNAIQEEDLTSSNEIISELNNRVSEQKDLEKNGKQTRVIALTNEYIMSLENYLNNPNSEIRLMAAKEVLTRLDEDKDRYDDAALNALLNKMLQDPDKLVRIAALSAFSSQLASGNDYTVELLTKIQNDPNADKEDVLQAADGLLKMSTSTEVKYTPVQKKEVASVNNNKEAEQKQIEQLKEQLQAYKEKEINQALQVSQVSQGQ